MNMLTEVRTLNSTDFQYLAKIVAAESNRRERISKLEEEINDKLHELSGLLSGADSLCILNNLTGEVMSAVENWDEPENENDYLAPQLSVRLGILRD